MLVNEQGEPLDAYGMPIPAAPKRKEYGIEMDGIAQMLGLDIFDYDPGDVARAIAKLQKSEWIACAVRMPEAITAVLVISEVSLSARVYIARYMPHVGPKTWWLRDSPEQLQTVSYWMPLPDLPC